MRVIAAIATILLITATAALAYDSDWYVRRASWPETLRASREAWGKLQERARAQNGFRLYDSGSIPPGEAARNVKVNVSGLKELWLLVNPTVGDNIGCRADWGDAKLIGKDGKETWLGSLKPCFARQDYGKLTVDSNGNGDPMQIGDRKFSHGIWTHANSEIGYELGGNYEFFEAWIGHDRSSDSQGMRFRVMSRSECNDRFDALWPLIKRDFAEGAVEVDWLQHDGLARPGAAFKEAAQHALQLATATLALAERSASQPQSARELKDLRQQLASAGEGADWLSFYLQAHRFRRRALMACPLLGFDKLLICKTPPPRSADMATQNLGIQSRPGEGLVVLDSWRDAPRSTVLLAGKLPKGATRSPDLSFDAKHVIFSFCDHTPQNQMARRFLIYEAATDGSAVRQLTGTATDPQLGAFGRRTVRIEDIDPAYLPDGGFAFVSTRNQAFGRCHGGVYEPSYVLHRADADGSNIRRISFGEANEWEPAALHDGRIIYSRWDYINRHDVIFQSLWTTRPDGSSVAHFYGNVTPVPNMVSEARAIPGSRKIVCTACAHHAYTAGTIITIDPLNGQEGFQPVKCITPDVPYPEREPWNPSGGIDSTYATPWPLSEDLFLVAWSPERLADWGSTQSENAYGIYLVDSFGGRELIYRDPAASCMWPIPLVPRPRPPVIPSTLAKNSDYGTFYIQDVYNSTETIERGSVKGVRVVRLFEQPTAAVPIRSRVENEIVKGVVGTVPVNASGSAVFRAPAGVPLLLQLIDGNNMSVMSMRTQIYLQPGEKASCVGCHEPRYSTPSPDRQDPVPMREIEPPPASSLSGHGFSFARTAQPVLDRYCIGCHGLGKKEKDLNLLGTPTQDFNGAYESLVDRPGLVKLAPRNQETCYSRPKDYGSHAGKLAGFLLGEHRKNVEIDPVSFTRIVEWLDLNGQYYGDYSFSRPERRKPVDQAVQALRDHIQKTFGDELASQPIEALINAANLPESRILMAPLAAEAGGWGQIKNGWPSKDAQGCKEMLRLVQAALPEQKSPEIDGTCGLKPCVCNGCWVRNLDEQEGRK